MKINQYKSLKLKQRGKNSLRNKTTEKIEQRFHKLYDNIRFAGINVVRIPEGEEKMEAKEVFKEIMANKFPS